MPEGYSLIWAIWVCGAPEGYGFSATLVVNRMWFWHSSLEMLGMFLGRTYFFTITPFGGGQRDRHQKPNINYYV